ncbi:NAD(P)-dependent oxidoreductase [Alkalibacterium sp.]|nr:MAG: hydroxyacid dehydrogenase [Alkalibacterium sp.]
MSKLILSLSELKKEHEDDLKKLSNEYTVIHSLEEASSVKDIEIVYGWNKEEGPKLLENPEMNVKWIQLTSAGVDYMDLALLNKHNITLTNASGIHSYAISESIFGMLLSHTRGIGYSIKKQMKNEWDEVDEAFEMNQRTMAIVGAGEIGRQTGKLAKAFGMKTIGVNRSGKPVDFMDEQFTQAQLAEALADADVVVNILPLTDETRNLFDLDLFKKMKQSAIFINVGRGSTVVTDDLLEALDEGIIAFAALDVVHQEPLPTDHPIYQRDDVLLTPHISGTLEDYSESAYRLFEENFKDYAESKTVSKNVVDYQSGY